MSDLTSRSLVWLGLFSTYQDIRYAMRWYRKSTQIISVLLLLFAMIAIEMNWYRSKYSIATSKTNNVSTYEHADDTRTTDIINYLTGHGPFPESERLAIYRQYVKNRLEEQKMKVPDDFFVLDLEAVNALAITWYKKKFPKYPRDKKTLQRMNDKLFEEAVRPPLEGFTPNVDDNLWRLLEHVGSPKVRWIEEQDDLPSRLVAYSAGDKQSFYYPVDNTIYIQYADSVANLLDEVGHVKQFREQPLRSHGRMGWSMLTAWIGAEFDFNNAIEIYHLRYKTTQTFEGEAHGPLKNKLLEEYGLLTVEQKVTKKK